MATIIDQDETAAGRPEGSAAARAWQAVRAAARAVRMGWRAIAGFLNRNLPKGLYARSLIIIIAPVVLIQALVAFVFLERHFNLVTARLSAVVVQDIAALIDVINTYPQDADHARIAQIAQNRMGLSVSVLPAQALPAPAPKPFFTLLDRELSYEITRQIKLPFWVDTVGRSNLIEIRIQLAEKMLRVIAPRSHAYVSSSEIFTLWMVASSLVILAIAILFLRNQIRPIQRLARAAESFGKGQPTPDFRPRGAREVRLAGQAFIEMRERIERQMEQRTTMLAGVSHDLRTVLTRFRLQLAFLTGPDAEALARDVEEMQGMLEGYLAFARGDAGEQSEITDIEAMLAEIAEAARATGAEVSLSYVGQTHARVRPQGMRRLLTNLATNAARHGTRVAFAAAHDADGLTVTVDDNGNGIAEDEYEAVFKPFVRLDEARNLDQSGTGLGLAIALDIARVHGGDIRLDRSPLGGLRAIVHLPV